MDVVKGGGFPNGRKKQYVTKKTTMTEPGDTGSLSNIKSETVTQKAYTKDRKKKTLVRELNETRKVHTKKKS